MADASYLYTDFRGGFWSASAQGRMDDPEYKRALNECYNGYPIESGAWVRRPPFRAIGYTRFGVPARLLSLASVTKTHYNMEITDGHFRFIHGAEFVVDATTQTVIDVSLDKPSIVTTTDIHGWADGDQVIFDLGSDANTNLALARLASRIFFIQVLSPTTFKIFDIITGKGFDGTTAPGASVFTCTVSKLTDVVTVYTGDMWKSVKRTQTDANTFLWHPAVAPQVLEYTEANDASWTDVSLSKALFKDGPYLDAVEGSIVTPDATKGLINLTFSFTDYDAAQAYAKDDLVTHSTYHWVSLADENFNNAPADGSVFWRRVSALHFLKQHAFAPTDIGRHIRLFSEPPLWTASGTYDDGKKVKLKDAYWMSIAAGVTGDGANKPGSDATKWVPAADAAIWSWGKIVSVNEGAGASGKVDPTTALGTVGDITGVGGVAGLFNGTSLTQDTASPQIKGIKKRYAGLHLGSAVAISSARVFPSKNSATKVTEPKGKTTPNDPHSLGGFAGQYTFVVGATASVQVLLYGKASAPSSATDGTLLGTSAVVPYNEITAAGVTVVSSNAVGTWNYIWVVLNCDTTGTKKNAILCASEVEFYTGSGGVAGNGIQIQLYGDPLLYTAVINTWQLGLFNDTDPVYPVCGCFADGRLWMSVGKNRVVGSVAGDDHLNMAPTKPDGTVTDASGINYVFNSEVNATANWMHPGPDGILIGLSGGERLIFSTVADKQITPTTANVELKTSYGSSDVEPIQAPLTTLFVHANGRDIHEYMRDASSGRFVAPPLTEFSKSLTNSGVLQIAYQRALTSILWAVTQDGSLIGSTYERTYLPFRSESPPKYNGWHHHGHGAPRAFTSVSVGPSLSGSNMEALTVVTQDAETGLCRIECASDLMPENNDIFDCNYLDGMFVPASGGNSVVAGENPDSGGVIPPPPPPPPPDSDPFGCAGTYAGYYRTGTLGTAISRTFPVAFNNGSSGIRDCIVYQGGVLSVGNFATYSDPTALGVETPYTEPDSCFNLDGSSPCGQIVVVKITAILAGVLFKGTVVETWQACSGVPLHFPAWPEVA